MNVLAALERATRAADELRVARVRRDVAIADALRAGATLREIAELTDLSRQRVMLIARERGLRHTTRWE